MARRNNKSKAAKPAKPAKQKAARRAEAIEVVEEVEKDGMGLEEGIAITTFLLLAGAIALVLVAMQRYSA